VTVLGFDHTKLYEFLMIILNKMGCVFEEEEI